MNISQDPLNHRTFVQSMRDAARLFNDNRASQTVTAHPVHFNKTDQLGLLLHSSQRVKKIKAHTSIVLIILFYVKTIKYGPLAFYILSVLLNMH